jgi:hypothetical protein
MSLSQLSVIHVSFALPLWFPPERFEYTKTFYYSKGHAWAGQVERTESENTALDNLWRLKGISEVCHDPHGPTVTIEVDATKDVKRQIAVFQAKLERLLNRYREARAA